MDLNKQQFDLIKTLPGITWKCNECRKGESSTTTNDCITTNTVNCNCAGIIAALTDAIKALKASVEELKNQVNGENRSDPTKITTLIINEISERQTRENNMIVFGIEENTGNEAATADKYLVKEIVNTLVPDMQTEDIKVYRIGTPGQNKRPLKVIMNNKNEVYKVLKNKYKLKDSQFKNLNIVTDQTKLQRDYYKKTKDELEDRKSKGEQLYIKYINGTPTIVKSKN